jgi:hypothetical protein
VFVKTALFSSTIRSTIGCRIGAPARHFLARAMVAYSACPGACILHWTRRAEQRPRTRRQKIRRPADACIGGGRDGEADQCDAATIAQTNIASPAKTVSATARRWPTRVGCGGISAPIGVVIAGGDCSVRNRPATGRPAVTRWPRGPVVYHPRAPHPSALALDEASHWRRAEDGVRPALFRRRLPSFAPRGFLASQEWP